ncbi:sulfite reductase flavoprotein subunit alpha [Stenotrophomonas sp. MMGLT7]|uniref:sulfite reductase flavoprotein subunit alpha n=1 Tax=Stenotrophomonas sp. MMGLT7 TaxID=2901227 RepID=UPI001E299069|nr:sulfite reductase flavoprotein subunit alpha [Stenotrophomonas sp. MMGLT7]MCD7099029.1 sulfite reductase flavoprotein subunit alpha [Stenotrophomonas sp. MMGLT7]
MLKKILFQLHWVLGISAGLVLALMGLSGATMSFEDEIVRWANPPLADAAARHAAGQAPLPLGELARRLDLGGEHATTRMLVDPTGTRPSNARLVRGGRLYFDPYSGQVLPEPRLSGLFAFVEDLHRRLVAGERGKAVTGACVIVLLFFCLSGLYLRWPRQWWSWRAWWAVEWKRKGRGFLWSLHSVIGTWCLLVYLGIALTGLYWSYGWYRQGLVAVLGGEAQAQGGGGRGGTPAQVDFGRLQAVLDGEPGLRHAYLDLRLPARAGQPLVARYLADDPAHSRAFDTLEIDLRSGRVERRLDYRRQPLGRQLLASVFALHSGSFFGLPGRIVVMLASLCMPLFFVTGWLLYLDRRRKQRQARALRGDLHAPAAGAGEPWLVGFASQSGLAEQLAWRTAGQLQAAGLPVRVQPLARLEIGALADARRAVFVVSTFGDGDPPDSARAFEKTVLRQAAALPQLGYALLALGDRQYARFCGFSRRLEQWLHGQGAQPLFPAVEVDNADPQALAQWQRQLAGLTGHAPAAEAWSAPPMQPCALLGRERLNPGSAGGPVWRIDLRPWAGAEWRAGDILEVQPCRPEAEVRALLAACGLDADAPVRDGDGELPLWRAAALRVLPDAPAPAELPPQSWIEAQPLLPHREYSIASVPQDGVLQLVVRLAQRADGRPGLGSGWLGLHAQPGERLLARLRSNPGFHRGEPPAPMILVGNGTGIAGLRSLLREAQLHAHHGHWLLFGERSAAHDFLFGEELRQWQAQGHLRRLDLAFSRDLPHRHYVQDRLREAAAELAASIAAGATIHVCGSLEGMAEGVDRALRDILGEDAVDALAAAGRYRRDVY